MAEEKKLSKAVSGMNYNYVTNPLGPTFYNRGYTNKYIDGDINYPNYNPLGAPYNLLAPPTNYEQELRQSRFFYKYDPFASTVINRMAEMIAGKLKHRRGFCTDEEYFYFVGLADRFTQLIQQMALEYLIAGMAVPDYLTKREMGRKIHPELGRTRYVIPDQLWLRNSDNIILKRQPASNERRVYLKIPQEERDFIINKGEYPDGTKDEELYRQIVRQFPEYVKLIEEGRTTIPLPDAHPILRKPTPNCDYPQPFLVPALSSLKHKMRIKEMDYTMATRAIEAIRLVKAGSDEYPVTEDDPTLMELRDQMIAKSNNANLELIYTLYANHTVTIEWVYPPFDTLLSTDKYLAVDADIFMAMGFSRVLLTGESLRSNSSGTGDITILGPLATLTEARSVILEWIRKIYRELADVNGFINIPDPNFDPLTVNDAQVLIQYAATALKDQVISRNTYAQLFNTDFETEQQQRTYENEAVSQDTVTIDHEVMRQETMQEAFPDQQQTQQTGNPRNTGQRKTTPPVTK